MKKRFTLLLFVLCLPIFYLAQAQQQTKIHHLKGNGEVFFYEDFDWSDSTAPQGWRLTRRMYIWI